MALGRRQACLHFCIAAIVLLLSGWSLVLTTRLLLPFPSAMPLLNMVMPLFNMVMALAAIPFNCHWNGLGIDKPQRWQKLTVIGATFAVYNVLAVLAILSLFPAFRRDIAGCQAELQWKTWYRAKDEVAIRSVQDRLRCCGLNSMPDRAWPFPAAGVDARTCERTSGYPTHCGPLWQAYLASVAVYCAIASLLNMFMQVSMVWTVTTTHGCMDSESAERDGLLRNPRDDVRSTLEAHARRQLNQGIE